MSPRIQPAAARGIIINYSSCPSVWIYNFLFIVVVWRFNSCFCHLQFIDLRPTEQPFHGFRDPATTTIMDKAESCNKFLILSLCTHPRPEFIFTYLASPLTPAILLKTSTCNFSRALTFYWVGKGNQ